MEDVKIQFEGFSPPSVVHTHFSDLLKQIRDEAPTWSNIRASISQVGEEFRGVIRITSHVGEFFSTASPKGLVDLGRKLNRGIRRQLNQWKAARFSSGAVQNRESFQVDGHL